MENTPDFMDRLCEHLTPSKAALSIAQTYETIGKAIEIRLKTATDDEKSTLQDMNWLYGVTARILRWQVREMRRVLALALIESAGVIATGLWLLWRAL